MPLPTLEESLPRVGQAQRVVVAFLMRGRKHVGSTFMEVLKKIAD
jgi:hypothetical protein